MMSHSPKLLKFLSYLLVKCHQLELLLPSNVILSKYQKKLSMFSSSNISSTLVTEPHKVPSFQVKSVSWPLEVVFVEAWVLITTWLFILWRKKHTKSTIIVTLRAIPSNKEMGDQIENNQGEWFALVIDPRDNIFKRPMHWCFCISCWRGKKSWCYFNFL